MPNEQTSVYLSGDAGCEVGGLCEQGLGARDGHLRGRQQRLRALRVRHLRGEARHHVRDLHWATPLLCHDLRELLDVLLDTRARS